MVIQSPECAGLELVVSSFYLSISPVWAKSLSLIVLMILPFWSRSTLTGTAILDFNERVSLYPMTLLAITVLMSCNALSWALIISLLLALFSSVVQLDEGKSITGASFKSGLFISLLGLFSAYFFLLLLFTWIAFSIVGNLNWRAIVWSLLGIITPYYLITSIGYIATGDIFMDPFAPFLHLVSGESSNKVGLSAGLYILIIITISVLFSIRTLRTSRKGIVKRRKILRVGLLLFAFCLVISLLLFQFTPSTPYLGILAVPLSVLSLEFLKDDAPKIDALLFISWVILTCVYLWN